MNCEFLIVFLWMWIQLLRETCTLRQLLDPLTLRLKLRDSHCNRTSSALWAFGPGIVSPVENVANALITTPKSTPTTPWFSALGRCESSWVSTAMVSEKRSFDEHP